MIQLDMTCLTCYWGCRMDNDLIANTYDVEPAPIYVICKAVPDWKMISAHSCGELIPDIFNDPEYHWCGHGRWWDKENGKWIGLLDAEDCGPSVDE